MKNLSLNHKKIFKKEKKKTPPHPPNSKKQHFLKIKKFVWKLHGIKDGDKQPVLVIHPHTKLPSTPPPSMCL